MGVDMGADVGVAEALNPTAVKAAAITEAGLDDFGDDSFDEGLSVYLRSAADEAGLSEMGTVVIQSGVIRALVNRLRFVQDLKRHPEIAAETLVAPIVILGVPRTGTTKLQRMISTDKGVQRLDLWRLLNPAPLPGGGSGPGDPRRTIAVEYEQMLAQLAPDFMAAHPTLASEPDEDAYLLDLSFECLFPQLRTHVPSYGQWLSGQSGTRPYAYLRSMLQYLQWQDGGGRGRPWVLKTPLHLGNLARLVETFPGATLVHCHRDLGAVVPSICRMVQTARHVASAHVDPLRLGTEMLGLWSGEMAKYIEQRDKLEAAGTLDILDIDYREIVGDTPAVISRIYGRAGREVSPDARRGFAEWEARNPQHRHGHNHYTLSTYGLTDDAINEAFSPYLARFA
jgi:hypothetical protein